MIGGLQGEFGDLDIKYLKQNISKNVGRKYQEAWGEFRSRAKFAFSLEWTNSNGCNSFISTPNHTSFEALDF